MNIKKFVNENWTFFLYLILSLGTVLPFFASGFFAFHDDVQVARIFEMGKSLASGSFPVRWVPDLGYGAGYPIFNFYSVLPYYIGGFIALIGIDALFATKIVFVFGIIASGISMYFLTKEFFGKIAALTAAIIYLYFPYHAVNVYVRGDLAELFAYIFLPLVFLSLFKINLSKKISKHNIILGALSVAAVILSHNLSAFMLFIFVSLFIVASIVVGKNKKDLIVSYLFMFGLAFLLSAFYAIPAALEAGSTNIASVIRGGSDFRQHYVCLSQLWDSPWGFGGSTAGCIDGISFKLGKLNIILGFVAVIIAILEFKRLKEKKIIVITSILFLFLSIFMLLEYSSFLWNLPFMEFLQFPWRFLNFVALFISVVCAYLVSYIYEKYSKSIAFALAFGIIAVTFFMNMKLFFPQKMLNRDTIYYTNQYYLNWTASKISDEYLPKDILKPKSSQEVAQFKRIYGKKSFSQTQLELSSDFITIIGLILLLGIILYGKKAS